MPAKPEAVSKKTSTPGKPATEAKTSKPKESKPTPSKETNAALKTSSAKTSTAKTTSPKKVVGSSTPIPVKRGPKAVQKEKEVVAPAVETAAAVEVVAVAAAATAAGAFIAVTKNESEVQTELLPESKPEVAPEIKFEVSPETKLEHAPEPKLEHVPETKIEEAPEPKPEDAPKPTLEDAFEPTSPSPLVTEFQLASETKPEHLPETISELLPETMTELEPEPTSDHLLETESKFTPETMSELLLETRPEIASEPRSDNLLESEYEFIPETMSELLLETKPAVVPEPEFELPLEKEPEYTSKHLLETNNGFAPEPQSELPLKTESQFTSEIKSEFPSVPEHKSEPLLGLETESEIAPELQSELLLETESEIGPKPMSELLLETESEIVDEPESQLLFETKPKHLSETVPEPTVESLITAAVEDIVADTKNIPSETEEETPEEVVPQQAAKINLVSLEHSSASSTLGTTVMSPPSSPTGEPHTHVEPQISAPLQDMYAANDSWTQNQTMFSSDISTENLEQEETRVHKDLLTTMESLADESVDVKESFSLGVESSSRGDHFSSVSPTSPNMEKEEAVEKADEEINEDDHDEEEEDEEEQEERDMVKVQTVPETHHVDDFKFGLSECISSSSSIMQSDDLSRIVQQGQAETTSPFQMESYHIDEDGQDFSLKKAETEQPFMGPPGLKSFSDEEEEEDEEEEQEKEDMDTGPEHTDKDHMNYGHEQTDDHHMDVHHKSEEEEEHEDEDVEMTSEGHVESGSKIAENVDEDDYEEGYLDNLNRTAPAPSIPMTAAWGPSNPFADTWTQPASINITSSPSDDKAADLKTPTKSPAEAWLEKPLGHLTEPHLGIREETESSVPVDGANLCAPAIGMSQSSTLSGTALAAHSSSETSTPEELRDYDSSSGVESRSDKQQTPVPTAQPDQEQDLGIHLERGDGEEEEAETLPADEVLGDAPTAPASVPSSPSTSGDEASDTEGEMQINDPDAPVDDIAALDSPTASRNLPALEEDEEAAMQAVEEDGGTPQSANSVASYGFDCSVSNSNAHSTAESCGKSPGIFSLENEDQLPEEAKDPSLIKELTLPAAAAQAEDLLGCPVDLLPLSQQGESHTNLDDQYLLCGKTGASALEESDPESPMHLSPQHGDSTDGQPPYYSTICDNTDSFLAGNV